MCIYIYLYIYIYIYICTFLSSAGTVIYGSFTCNTRTILSAKQGGK